MTVASGGVLVALPRVPFREPPPCTSHGGGFSSLLAGYLRCDIHDTAYNVLMLTLTQAAARLGLAASTLRVQVHRRKLRARLIGKTYVVTEREIARYRAASLGRRRPKVARLGRLSSFGYSGIRSADQLRTVLEGVDLVVDVRLSQRSRLPLWGHATPDTILATGRRYEWLPDLGNTAYKTGGIRIADITQVDTVLAELRARVNVALMCVCSDAATCHRSVIVAEILRREPSLPMDPLHGQEPVPIPSSR